jgi:hypothetical protein
MEPFVPSKATGLHWVRTAERPAGFELRDLDVPVAALGWVRHGGSLAEVETAAGRWSLKRTGFLHPVVTVRPKGGPATDLARLTVHWRRSLLESPGATPAFLERAGIAIPAWQLVDASGHRLFHVEPVSEGGRLAGGTVSVDPAGQGAADLLLALVVAWYYVVLQWAEEELASATASALVSIS